MTERTDPWVWYCRLCGAWSEHATALQRNLAARIHVADGQPCGQGGTKASASAGRLLHVWSWGPPADLDK